MATLLLAFTPMAIAAAAVARHSSRRHHSDRAAAGAQEDGAARPAFTLREDNGVTKVCPVHTGRAKKDEPPILERGLDNYANPRGLSFLPPRRRG